ncbi:MAG: hypothetical protein ABW047_11185 [Nitrospiraceae bacterium]
MKPLLFNYPSLVTKERCGGERASLRVRRADVRKRMNVRDPAGRCLQSTSIGGSDTPAFRCGGWGNRSRSAVSYSRQAQTQASDITATAPIRRLHKNSGDPALFESTAVESTDCERTSLTPINSRAR